MAMISRAVRQSSIRCSFFEDAQAEHVESRLEKPEEGHQTKWKPLPIQKQQPKTKAQFRSSSAHELHLIGETKVILYPGPEKYAEIMAWFVGLFFKVSKYYFTYVRGPGCD